jgi:hypothetical protein
VREGAASILCLLPISTDGRAGRERSEGGGRAGGESGVREMAEREEREE